ncbi:hypothetical protein K9M41_03110, partial [Candidatus Gracilibacteria bacterium]|nr:hypothetical protein [Candidatus Gracilibacteria bacterium]
MLKDIKSIDTVLREGSIDPDRLDEYISEQREVLFTLGLDLFLEDKCNNRTPEAEGFCKEIGIGPTVMNTVSRVRNVINEKTLIDGLVLAGCETRERIEKAIGANVFPEGLVRRPGMKDQELLEKYDWIRQDWFLKNASLNWLRLAGILDPVSYEEVFQNAGYNLMDKQNNSEFAYFVSKYGAENANHMLLNGKDVLTIGGGSGRDEIFWAKSRIAQVDVKSITMVDASPSAIGEMKKRVKVLSS